MFVVRRASTSILADWRWAAATPMRAMMMMMVMMMTMMAMLFLSFTPRFAATLIVSPSRWPPLAYSGGARAACAPTDAGAVA